MAAAKKRLAKRGVGIVRISKDRAEQSSTTTQTEAIERYCAEQGIELVAILEERKSAYKESVKLQTPAKALRMIKSGEADVVICYRVDRVARRVRDLLNLIHDIEQAGGAFVATSQREFDTQSAFGKALMGILAVLAELESALKAERICDWQESRRAEGLTPTGPTPFGYRRERNQLIVIPEQAKLINQMVDALLDGQTLSSQVRWLVAQKHGVRKTMRGLRLVLTGPTIAGLREIEGAFVQCNGWKPIVERERWEAVREVLLNPARRMSPTNDTRHLLSGLLECATCKYPMRRKTHPHGLRYACNRCHQSINAAHMDEVIEGMVLAALDPKAWRTLQKRASINHVDLDAIQTEIAKLRKMRDAGMISDRQHELLYADCIERLQSAESGPVQLPDVADLRAGWGEMLMKQRRIVVAAVLPRIVIRPIVRKGSSGRFDADRIVIASFDDDEQPA
jgi:DNA invertase Pin-like site-specific DNA recombinase